MNLVRWVLVPFLLFIINSDLAAGTRQFNLGNWGSLELEVPEGWKVNIQGQEAEGGPAIRIEPGQDIQLILFVTPLPLSEAAKDGESSVERTVNQAIREASKVAVEKKLQVHELKGKESRGRYFSATDRTVNQPNRTDFKYMDQGAATVGRLIMTFTVLTNEKSGPTRTQALAIVRSARYVSP